MFCDNLNTILKARGIKQKQLAAVVGVNKATMCGYNKGSAYPSAALLAGSDAERELICAAAGNDDLCRALLAIARGEPDRLTVRDAGN